MKRVFMGEEFTPEEIHLLEPLAGRILGYSEGAEVTVFEAWERMSLPDAFGDVEEVSEETIERFLTALAEGDWKKMGYLDESGEFTHDNDLSE